MYVCAIRDVYIANKKVQSKCALDNKCVNVDLIEIRSLGIPQVCEILPLFNN